ncbi:MAG: hypothetical protein ACXIU7_13460 [Roseinatronobacter sp.]
MQPSGPDRIVLRPGESIVAVIPSDFRIRILSEALLGVAALIGVVLLSIALDLHLGRPLSGVRLELLMTFALMAGPVIAQRILARPEICVLTTQRLFFDPETTLALRDITRLQVWLTSLRIEAGGKAHLLAHLVDPAGAAQLIRETIPTRKGA